jgi:hypothetical protein
MNYILKIAVSAVVLVSVSEVAKKFVPLAAILASLPLTSILAMIWLYRDTHDSEKIIELSYGIFWAVLPSLVFFILLPTFLKMNFKFVWALLLSSGLTFLVYTIYALLLKKWGIRF